MINKINKDSLYILIPLAVISALFNWKIFPISILIGGAIGILNLKGIHWAITMMTNSTADIMSAKGKIIIFSIFRLLGVFIILSMLLYLKIINILATFIGFTVVFIIMMKEGFKEVKKL